MTQKQILVFFILVSLLYSYSGFLLCVLGVSVCVVGVGGGGGGFYLLVFEFLLIACLIFDLDFT